MVHHNIQEELEIAARHLKRLRNAKTCKMARRQWIDFLQHSNLVFTMLEGYANDTGQKSKYRRLEKKVWGNPLAKFMRTARNTGTHGVKDAQILEPYNDRIVLPEGQILGTPAIYSTRADGSVGIGGVQAGPVEILYASPGIRTVVLKPGIRMVPVITREGETVMPPPVQIESEDESEPAAAARMFLRWLNEEVAKFH